MLRKTILIVYLSLNAWLRKLETFIFHVIVVIEIQWLTWTIYRVIFNVLSLLSSNNLQGAIDFLHRFLKELGHYGIKPQDQITAYSYHNLGVLYLLARRADLAQTYFFDSLNIQTRCNKGPSEEKLVC